MSNKKNQKKPEDNGWVKCNSIEKAQQISGIENKSGKKTELRAIWHDKKNKCYYASQIAGPCPFPKEHL